MIKKYDLKDLTVNLLLTPTCNLGCASCIAKDFMAEKKPNDLIKLSDISELERRALIENPSQFNLLGGEPTLHPSFFQIANQLYRTGTHIGVSTNGLWGDKVFEEVSRGCNFPIEWEVTFLEWNKYRPEQKEKLKRTFSLLKQTKSVISIGAIIDSPDYNPAEHLDIAEQNGFEIRWTLSEPIATVGKLFGYQNMSTLKKYGQVVKNIVLEADKRGIETWGDIAVPRCAFNTEDIYLFEGQKHDVRFVCPPFFDIGPNLEIWRCLPLRPNAVRNLKDYSTFREAYDSLVSGECYLSSGIFEDCSDCQSFNKDCQGGPKVVNSLKFK